MPYLHWEEFCWPSCLLLKGKAELLPTQGSNPFCRQCVCVSEPSTSCSCLITLGMLLGSIQRYAELHWDITGARPANISDFSQ